MSWWPLATSLHLALFLNWGGVALQSGAIYLFALIIPLVIWFRRGQPLDPEVPGIAAGLAALWLIFPLGNIIVYGLDQLWGGFLAAGLTKEFGKGLMSSHTPSTVMVAAIVLLVAALVFQRFGREGKEPVSSYEPLWRQVLTGYGLSVIVIAAYVILQHVMGLDVRSATGTTNPENQMPSGFYRVHGFYGHTLSFASNALGLGTFFGVLALKLRGTEWGQRLWRPCAWLAVVMVVFIYLAGSRAVMLAAVVMATAIAISWLVRALPAGWRMALIAALVAVVVGAGALVATYGLSGLALTALEVLQQLPGGVGERFGLLAEKLVEGGDIPRLVFWHTHWTMFLDQPFFGHGYAFMSETTQIYYQQLGLGDYFRKYNAHNVYLQFIAEAGLFGLILLLGILSFLHKRLSRWRAGGGPLRGPWLTAFYWALGANAVHGFTQNTFFDANVVALYVLLLVLPLWFAGAAAPTPPLGGTPP